MTEPLVNDWAQMGSEVTVAALPHIAPVYKAIRGVKHVLEWPFERRKLQLFKRYRVAQQLRGQFDCCVVCPNSFKSALIPWIAGVTERLGYLGESRSWALTKVLPNSDRNHRESMTRFYRALGPSAAYKSEENLKQLFSGGERNALGTVQRDVPTLNLDREFVKSTLLENGLTQQAFTVIAPGAEYGPAKRWPIEYFSELALQVAQSGGTVLILGSTADQAMGEQIKNTAHEKLTSLKGVIKNLAGQTTLLQAMALISSSKCLISNDSGLMHIGAAFGVAQVAIFGSSSPLHTPPLSKRAKVLWLSLSCAPCFKRECPLGHTNCLRDISVADVVDAVQNCLTL